MLESHIRYCYGSCGPLSTRPTIIYVARALAGPRLWSSTRGLAICFTVTGNFKTELLHCFPAPPPPPPSFSSSRFSDHETMVTYPTDKLVGYLPARVQLGGILALYRYLLCSRTSTRTVVTSEYVTLRYCWIL